MTIQVTGKNLDLGEALRGYVQDRVAQTVERYIGRTPSGHVRIEKEHGEFRTNCTIHLWRTVWPRTRIRVRIKLASGWTSGCGATSAG